MSKNVAVFVDVANIFYAAKAAGVDIDYVTLLKASSAGRDLVRAYAYTGLDPDNENQRNFHDFLRRHGYKVVSKDIRKYGDGKVKANLDIELVVDMMKTARNLDIAIVVSGDGDFAPAIRAVQEMGVRVEVVSFRGNTSSDLIDVADQFTDITQVAKVEKGSSRSGRRVATDDEDLSMTEVPDKMTEGTGDGRRRGRGGRSRSTEAGATRSRTSSRAAAGREAADREAAARDAVVVEGTLVALPGEKLSRAARRPSPKEAAAEPEEELLVEEPPEVAAEAELNGTGGSEAGEEAHRRRRRRRGGRGRGRGRGREEGVSGGEVAEREEAEEFEEPEPLPAPRRPAFSFGSVWDSQLGKAPANPPAAAAGASGPSEEEDLEEPAIPEYLLAERRHREGGGRGRSARGPRGRGGAYAAALERERFGGGRGSAPTSRFAEPVQRHRDAVREPSARAGSMRRGYPRPEPRGSSSEPWSEVPPEIEAMLRAQLAASGRAGRPVASAPRRAGEAVKPESEASSATVTPASGTAAPAEDAAAPEGSRSRRVTTRRSPAAKAATAAAAAPGGGVRDEAPARPATRGRRSTAKAGAAAAPASGEASTETALQPATGGPAEGEAPKRGRRTRSSTPVGEGANASPAGESAASEAAATPRRRVTRSRKAAAD